MTQKRKPAHRTMRTTANQPLTAAEWQARLTLVVSAVGGLVALALVGALVYALFAADMAALRWWAGLATVVAVLAPFLGYFLGTSAARAHREGLQDGMETVQGLMQTGVATTMAAAADTDSHGARVAPPGECPADRRRTQRGGTARPGGAVALFFAGGRAAQQRVPRGARAAPGEYRWKRHQWLDRALPLRTVKTSSAAL